VQPPSVANETSGHLLVEGVGRAPRHLASSAPLASTRPTHRALAAA
jgi:hypothetical protein